MDFHITERLPGIYQFQASSCKSRPLSNIQSKDTLFTMQTSISSPSILEVPQNKYINSGSDTSSPALDQRAFFEQNGYLIIENALSPTEVSELRSEAIEICRGERGKIGGAPSLESNESDDEVMKKILCIHFPHKVSEIMRGYLSHPNMTKVLTNVIGPNVKCMQSMLFIKAAGKPGQAWHQDEFYIPTRDRSLIGGWIAMDDATVENGCLWVIPGSHKHGILWPQEEHFDTRFDCAGLSVGFPYTDEDSIPVEVKAGSIVFFNGYLLHRSLPNKAKSGYRRCLVNHYMSAESFLPWKAPQEGESMATADYRDIVMVAGKDPYAYKGLQNHASAFIRATREGGCVNWKGNKKKFAKNVPKPTE
jgi:phytanoyl-CoA hydroxylase